jgi:predicted SAM-dependent methyltransferase
VATSNVWFYRCGRDPANRHQLPREDTGDVSLIHQRYKDVFFAGLRLGSLPNHYLRKHLLPINPAGDQRLHLHLGCGEKYLAGFVNIDANPLRRIDLWIDVRNGLSFRDGTVDSIYASNVLEHFYPDDLHRVLTECHRALRPGAGMRAVVPNLRNSAQAYCENRSNWFSDWPRQHTSVGGRFSNFMFCDGQHRTAFDFGFLQEHLQNAGFSEVVECQPAESRLYDKGTPVFDLEADDALLPHFLYVEAFK